MHTKHLHCAMHTKQNAWQYICTVQCTQNICTVQCTQNICTVQCTQNEMPGSTFALCNAHETRCLAVHLHCAMHTKRDAWQYICTVQSARNEIFLLSILLISVSIILTKHCKQQHSIPYIAIINDGNNSIVSEKMSMYLWRSISTLYLHARQARATIGDSGLCCSSGRVYVPRIYTHARWELPSATQVFVAVLVWGLSSAN